MDNIAQQNMIAYAKQRLQKLYKRELYFEEWRKKKHTERRFSKNNRKHGPWKSLVAA